MSVYHHHHHHHHYHLPDEVLQEIMLRLPVKSLVQCTCVCKLWNSLIKNPIFIATHMRRTVHAKHPLLLARLCSKKKEYHSIQEHYYLLFDSENISPYKRLSLPVSPYFGNDNFRVIDSINGVICLADDAGVITYDYILWNPFIEKCLHLPEPEFRYVLCGPLDLFVGFGYSSETNDFKVLRIVELESMNGGLRVEVFSLNVGTWKDFTAVAPKDIHIVQRSPQAFVNGVIHCICFRYDGELARKLVVGFDVGNECFCEIMLPEECAQTSNLSISKYKDSTIAVFQMCIDGPKSRKCNAWVMKEYGVVESWTKIWTIAGSMGNQLVLPDNFFLPARLRLPPNMFRGYQWRKALGFTENGDILLQTKCGNIVPLNIETQETRGPVCEGRGYQSFLASHVESLMLLDKVNRVGQADVSRVADDTLSGTDVGNDDAISGRDANNWDYDGDELCS